MVFARTTARNCDVGELRITAAPDGASFSIYLQYQMVVSDMVDTLGFIVVPGVLASHKVSFKGRYYRSRAQAGSMNNRMLNARQRCYRADGEQETRKPVVRRRTWDVAWGMGSVFGVSNV